MTNKGRAKQYADKLRDKVLRRYTEKYGPRITNDVLRKMESCRDEIEASYLGVLTVSDRMKRVEP